MTTPRNDPSAPLTRFCLAVEEHRRTPEGRVRTSQQFVSSFFTSSEQTPEDRIFRHVPKEVRGPVISAWGIRGSKAALRDSDEKVASVVSDALLAGDLTPGDFEEGLSAALVIAWVPLPEWWAFWRGGVISKAAALKALTTAYELKLFDAAWFFDHLEARGGALKGTRVVSDGLTKEDLTDWIDRVHKTQNGTPAGLLDALGWEKLVGKTQNEALFGVLDAFAKKHELAAADAAATTDPPSATPEAESPEIPAAAKAPEVGWSAPPDAPGDAPASLASAVVAHATKAATAKADAQADPDLAETGPYASPAPSAAQSQKKVAAARPVAPEIPVVTEEDEVDETKRFLRGKQSPAQTRR